MVVVLYVSWYPKFPFFKWLFQLDDEPNLYLGDGWKSPFPSIKKVVVWGSRQVAVVVMKELPIF